MTQEAPGRSHRKGLTVRELLRMFPDDATAEKWFEKMRWPKAGSTLTAAAPIPQRSPAGSPCPTVAETAGAISP